MIKNKLIDFFHFSKGEQRGILLLVGFIIIARLLSWGFPFLSKEKENDFSKFETEINLFEASLIQDKEVKEIKKAFKNPVTKKVRLKNFDPNSASKNELLELGIKAKTVNTIINYRTKGGRFYKAEDLLKIYGFHQKDYDRLASFIKIKSVKEIVEYKPKPIKEISHNSSTKKTYSKPKTSIQKDSFAKTKKKFSYPPKPKPKIIDINRASQEEWMSIRGIGPAYSKRIIKFKNALGGFHSIDQLKDVYGIEDSTFQVIKPYLKLDSNYELQKIKINELAADSLVKHPYLQWKQANAIVNYREMHGAYLLVENLQKIHLIDELLYQKLMPYIGIE